MGVIEDETLQVVVGPGTVNKVAAETEDDNVVAYLGGVEDTYEPKPHWDLARFRNFRF